MRQKTRYPGIYRTDAGTYEVFYRDPNGKQRTKSKKRLQDALAFQRETQQAVRRGDFIEPKLGRTTFEDWAETYLTQKLKIERRTRDKYRESLDNHLLPAFGGIALGNMSPDLIQEWVSGMTMTEYQPGKTYGAETIRGHYSLLAAILKKAATRGIIPKSPCVEIELPRIHRKERCYLTEDQVGSLIQATPDRYRVLDIVAAYLGLRWQELAGLRRSAVSMIPGKVPSLRVISTIERSNGTYQVKEYGKSQAARRTLKMPVLVAEALAWHLATFPSDEWVFTSPRGGFLRYDNFRGRFWEPATQAAGLAPLDLHELRHTAAAFMFADGANPLQVMRRMGHEDIRTTYNLYGHLFEDDEDALVERLNQRALEASQRSGVRDLLGMASAKVIPLPPSKAEKAV